MTKQYTKEQLWKLYEKLSKELQEAIFAEKTADSIDSICKKNEISEKDASKIAEHVGYVLLGILPPEDFQKILEKEIKLKKDVTKKVTYEINRFIFSSVKENLSALYKIEIAPPEKLPTPPAEEKKAPPRKDIYREPIE